MHWAQIPTLWAFICLAGAGSSAVREKWAVYYADGAVAEDFRGYKLLVFDADRHPAVEPLTRAGALVLGYLSLGEVNRDRVWFGEVREKGILLEENPNWPGSYYVDVRHADWRKFVNARLVPEILAQGFQGVFLDTLDDPVELERRDPVSRGGMSGAAMELVKELRREFPSITIMMNRAYALLPAVAGSIDIALGESVYGTYDFQTKVYRAVPEAEYREQVRLLKEARARRPSLRICSLDYWDPGDRAGIRKIYRLQRANGFQPYVATVGLDQLVREPH